MPKLIYLPINFIQLNLTGHCHGLSPEEIKDLWVQADIDGNGVVDYDEFQVPSCQQITQYLKFRF